MTYDFSKDEMSLSDFRALTHREFWNSAVLNDIEQVFIERDRLRWERDIKADAEYVPNVLSVLQEIRDLLGTIAANTTELLKRHPHARY